MFSCLACMAMKEAHNLPEWVDQVVLAWLAGGCVLQN